MIEMMIVELVELLLKFEEFLLAHLFMLLMLKVVWRYCWNFIDGLRLHDRILLCERCQLPHVFQPFPGKRWIFRPLNPLVYPDVT
jgi:hypothetical protein